MSTIDTAAWDFRNVWTTQSGEISTRPGADKIFQMNGAGATSVPHGGFSCKLQFVDSIFHYMLVTNQMVTPNTLEIHVIDENLSDTLRVQVLPLGVATPIRAVTAAIVNGEIIISGPDMPTLWGYTGSGLVIASKEESVDVSVETLSMPNGICVSWAGRCVIAKGEAIFISDPLAPRTYTAAGIVTLPGTVYGLHVTANGSLVAATANGVYGLSSQAAAQGRKIVGSLQKLSNYQATGYRQTAMTPFGLYGLTKGGIKQIDVVNANEILLSDKTYVRSLSDMISYPDYREGTIFETSDGVAVSMGTLDQDNDNEFGGGICRISLEKSMKSWWTQKGIKRLVGVLREREGDDLFLMEKESAVANSSESCVYKYHIDHDSDDGMANEYYGGISGIVPVSSDMWPVVRAVYTETDNGGAMIKCAVRGEYRKNNGSLQETVTDTNGVVIGSAISPKDQWTANGPLASPKLRTRELDSYRFQFAKRTNDISIETSAQGGKARIGNISMDTGGYAQGRPK